ncbi:MAG: hypothetical protein KAW56_06785 [Candidatus Marinimicrobia bacterium]|nr:hypothetical protein [Candidatus Neomarinimicrobiota bacterium]
MLKNEDIYIKALRYAKEKGFSGFTFDDIFKDLELSKEEQEFLQMNTISTDNSVFWWVDEDRNKMTLSFDGRAMLLEHEELKDARASARRAMYIAIISILLTLASVVYQMFSI